MGWHAARWLGRAIIVTCAFEAREATGDGNRLGLNPEVAVSNPAPPVCQKGRSSWPAVVLASSWFDSWYPSTYGTWGLVPYGTRGLVSALAAGAKAIAAPIAAAANAGAMYLIVVFMMFSCLLDRRISALPNHGALANRCRHR